MYAKIAQHQSRFSGYKLQYVYWESSEYKGTEISILISIIYL